MENSTPLPDWLYHPPAPPSTTNFHKLLYFLGCLMIVTITTAVGYVYMSTRSQSMEPTVTGSNCCSPNKVKEGYKCIQDCGRPVQRLNDPPPGYSCLSQKELETRNTLGCPVH